MRTYPGGPVGPGGAGAGGAGAGGAGAGTGAGAGGVEPHLAASCTSAKTSLGIAMPYPVHWLCSNGIMLPAKASAPLSAVHFPQRSPTIFNKKPGLIAAAHSSAIV